MRALTIGVMAHEALQGIRMATVAGQSSAGLFLSLPPYWVIFLSWQGPPGPLTIQLPGELPGTIASGTRVPIKAGELHFPPPLEHVELRKAEVWRAPLWYPVGDRFLRPDERAARMKEMARQAARLRPGAGWSALLPVSNVPLDALTGFPASNPAAIPPGVPLAVHVLRAALQAGNTPRATTELAKLIGLGSGLTPSGDDLALGVLLAVHRWGLILLPDLDREQFSGQVVDCARQATSDLSASLIEAAARGQADPRLIAALDGLVAGWPPVDTCAAGLAAWGHSSGLDALLGMSLVV